MIPNQWYAVLDSDEVKPGRPVGVTRLGEKLVFWRDSHGRVSCQRDVCAHRGAALSAGKVLGDTVQCPFHGLRYDASGRCTSIPANGKESPVPAALPAVPLSRAGGQRLHLHLVGRGAARTCRRRPSSPTSAATSATPRRATPGRPTTPGASRTSWTRCTCPLSTTTPSAAATAPWSTARVRCGWTTTPSSSTWTTAWTRDRPPLKPEEVAHQRALPPGVPVPQPVAEPHFGGRAHRGGLCAGGRGEHHPLPALLPALRAGARAARPGELAVPALQPHSSPTRTAAWCRRRRPGEPRSRWARTSSWATTPSSPTARGASGCMDAHQAAAE